MTDIRQLENIAAQVRRDVIRMTHGAQSGHPGGALGCTEYLVALYFRVMKHNPSFHMDGVGEDLFFLSNGHICAAWYSVLARSGYFDIKELSTFRKINSRLQGHPATAEHLPGVRIATGSLGQGLSVAIGAALAKKLNGDERLVYSLHGDGEIQEGQIWEAAMFAAHHKVDNLIAALDWNGMQIDGPNEKVLSLGDLPAKWKAFGWEVLLLKDGNNLQEVLHTLERARTMTGKGKPLMILMKTVMGKGVDFMENDYHWHGVAPDDSQTERALAQLPETLGDY
ncbi:MAG: transketolase [Chitinophagales bacterium]|nr:MAG: transketolase [Chitinophagales bacterium]